MKKEKNTVEKKCPVCEAVSRQMKKGFNKSGTQR
jgi:hypothetical protein